MLKLTRKADYGLISLKHMAMKNGSASAREIADTYGIPLPLLAKILQKLAKAGFVRSEHGAAGGYRLRRDAREMTVFDVIQSIDGPIFLTSCVTHGLECGVAERCNVREPLRKLHEGIQQLLENMTIAEMCKDEDGSAACAPAADTTEWSKQIFPVLPGV